MVKVKEGAGWTGGGWERQPRLGATSLHATAAGKRIGLCVSSSLADGHTIARYNSYSVPLFSPAPSALQPSQRNSLPNTTHRSSFYTRRYLQQQISSRSPSRSASAVCGRRLHCSRQHTMVSTVNPAQPWREPPRPPPPAVVESEQQWVFTEEELLLAPSITEGMPAGEERTMRRKGVNFILQVGMMLKLPQTTLSTAAVFFNRYLMRNSLKGRPGYKPLHHYVSTFRKRHGIITDNNLSKSRRPRYSSLPRSRRIAAK